MLGAEKEQLLSPLLPFSSQDSWLKAARQIKLIVSHPETAAATWCGPNCTDLGHVATSSHISTPGAGPGHTVLAVRLLTALGWPLGAQPQELRWDQPGAPLPTPQRRRKESFSWVLLILKYVVIEVLPTSLIGLALCLFSEPASHWFCQAWRKLVAAPHEKSLPWLASSRLTKNCAMQNQHNGVSDLEVREESNLLYVLQYHSVCFTHSVEILIPNSTTRKLVGGLFVYFVKISDLAWDNCWN